MADRNITIEVVDNGVIVRTETYTPKNGYKTTKKVYSGKAAQELLKLINNTDKVVKTKTKTRKTTKRKRK